MQRQAKNKIHLRTLFCISLLESALLTWYSGFIPEEHLRLSLVPYFFIAAVNYSNTELLPIYFTKIDWTFAVIYCQNGRECC